ncbi:MAG: hypothetical protein H7A43_08425 [Verrucomicrobia bacterium]|nr:hypothetical protein [Verrucomicrobiota bacterium]
MHFLRAEMTAIAWVRVMAAFICVMTIGHTLAETPPASHDNVVEDLSTPELQEVVLSESGYNKVLTAVYPEEDPRIWVRDLFAYRFLQVLTDDASDRHVPSGDEFTNRILAEFGVTGCRSLLRQTDAFRELSDRNGQMIWAVMKERSTRSPTVLDLCALADIMWGKELHAVQQPPSGEDVTASSSLPRAPAPEHWLLPAGTPEQWQELFVGSNGVYRLLAIKGLDLWAGSDELPSLLRTALGDPYLSIREEAVSRLDRLAPEMQAQLLDEYVQRKKPWVPITEAEREGEKWMNDRIAEKLKMLHVTSRPSSQSEQ